MSVTALLNQWQADREIASNFVAWRTLPSRPAQIEPFPDDLPAVLSQSLVAAGIHTLYSHQSIAWRQVRARKNILLSTGTASGKTLAYNLPVISAVLDDPEARALYL